MAQRTRVPNRGEAGAPPARRSAENGTPPGPAEALRTLQQSIGNAAVQRLLEPSVQRFDIDSLPAKDPDAFPTVGSFDVVGLEIYVLQPLRRAEGLVEQQEWEGAEPLIMEAAKGLILFFQHYTPTNPALAEELNGHKDFLGSIHTHVRHRQGKRDWTDEEIEERLRSTIADLEAERMPEELLPSASNALMRPGEDDAGEPGDVTVFDDVGLELYVLSPLRAALRDVQRHDYAAAREAFLPVGRALLEFHTHYAPKHRAMAERLLDYKNFLGIAYNNIRYRTTDLGPSDAALSDMMRVSIREIETVGERM